MPRSPTGRDGRGAENCTKDALATLYQGVFTFGTDQPVYPPWYMGDNPGNGEGFESALAYAVAGKIGYSGEDVRWVRVPFNAALAPGPKSFDANLSEFWMTDPRQAAVDFSSPYFDVTQAVVTVKSSPAACGKTSKRCGRSSSARKWAPPAIPRPRRSTAGSRSRRTTPTAMRSWRCGQVKSTRWWPICRPRSRWPTKFVAEPWSANSQRASDDVEQFGIVLDKGSALTRCVSWVVDGFREDGTLDQLEHRWLTDAGKAPVLT